MRDCETPTLNQVFKNWFMPVNLNATLFPEAYGIFQYIGQNGKIPETMEGKPLFSEDELNQLNILYHGGRSGSKRISPYVANILNPELYTHSYFGWVSFGEAIGTLYGKKWVKLYNTYLLEYNPIENYRMEEEGSETLENSGTSSKETKLEKGTSTKRTLDNSDKRTVALDTTDTLGTKDTLTHNVTDAISRTEEKELGSKVTDSYDLTNTASSKEEKTLGSTVTDSYDLTDTVNKTDTTTHGERIETRGKNKTDGTTTRKESGSYTDTTSGTKDNAVFAFNSSENKAVPSDSSTESGSVQRTFNDYTQTETQGIEVEISGTEMHSGDDKISHGGTDTRTGTVSHGGEGTDTTETTGGTTKRGTVSHGGEGTDTTTTSGSDTKTGTETTDHTGTLERSETGTDTLEHTGTITDTESGSDSATEAASNEGKEERAHTLTRSGNIGVTTSQQMIESERNLWLWDFYEVVFADLDKLLTLPIF